jgi:flagellar assembly factor FliW
VAEAAQEPRVIRADTPSPVDTPTIRVDTPRWGSIDVDPAHVLHFETGLAGFPDCARFIVMDHDRETPLRWLQSLDEPALAFVVVEPEQILPAYEVDVPERVMKQIGWNTEVAPEDVAIMLILNCDEGQLTANLRAPILVNVRTRAAFQLILDDPEIPLRHPVG